MKRPEIALDNLEMYDYYAEREQNPAVVKVGIFLMGATHHPDFWFMDEAEDELAQRMEDGVSIVLSPNHINDRDQFNVGAVGYRNCLFNEILNNVTIMGKVELFTGLRGDVPGFLTPLIRRPLRAFMDASGTLPVIRPGRDVPRGEEDTTTRRLLTGQTKKLLETEKHKLNTVNPYTGNRHHMLVFPEGTRNKIDPLRVQKLAGGVGRVVCGVDPGNDLAIVPMGLVYSRKQNGKTDASHPKIAIGRPLDGPFKNSARTVRELHAAMQDCVDAAAERST